MIAPNYGEMSRAQLRAYVIAHQEDQSAFQAFVDRVTAAASPETFDLPKSSAEVEAVDRLIKEKLATLN